MDKQDARVNKRAKERVSEVKEIKSKNGKTAIYVVNNTEGGWQLVSADTRMPVLVLGWNDTDEFSDFADANNGVKMVVGEFVGRISELQGIEPTEQEIESALGGIHAGLIPVPDHMLPSFPGEPGGCDPGSVEYYYSPVTAEDLSWDQNYPFDLFLFPMKNMYPGSCSYYEPSCFASQGWVDGIYAGCVPTAIAIAIRYNPDHGSAYSWSSMQGSYNSVKNCDNVTQKEAVANLYEDVFDYMQNEQTPSVSCDGTGFNIRNTNDLEDAVENLFSSINVVKYTTSINSTTAENLLKAYRPIVMRGEPSSSNNGHAWVVCGYYTVFYCDTGNTYKYLFHNWGWRDTHNGWFGLGDETPGSKDYRYDQAWWAFN